MRFYYSRNSNFVRGRWSASAPPKFILIDHRPPQKVPKREEMQKKIFFDFWTDYHTFRSIELSF